MAEQREGTPLGSIIAGIRDRFSSIPNALFTTAYTLALLYWGLVIWYGFTQRVSRALIAIILLGGSVAIYVLHEIRDELEEEERTWRTWLSIGALSFSAISMAVITGYFFLHFEELYLTRIVAHQHELYMAAVAFAVVTYLTWRAFGNVFLGLASVTMIYAYWGHLFPGVTQHAGLTFDRIMQIVMVDISGIYGSLTQVVAAWVVFFLLYAGLLEEYGAFDIIIRLASKTTKYLSSGVAQTAVISSALFGSINGSRTANAAMTGSITIPIMKESGVHSDTAAGIESTASSLGQILPPVMGSAAFLMASIIGISYAEVMIAGAIPALILVVCVGVATHLVVDGELKNSPDVNIDVEEMLDSDVQAQGDLRLQMIRFGIPFIVLVYLLAISRWTIQSAAMATIGTMILTGFGYPLYRDARSGSRNLRLVTWEMVKTTANGFYRGAVVLAPIFIIIAMINGVVDVLLATGVPSAITLSLMDITGGVLLFAAVIGMVICILLGMGMPTAAAYIIVALLVAPGFVNTFGVPELSAHYYVLYSALLSGLTPPVAGVCAVTAGIAQCSFLGSCRKSIKIFAPFFVFPLTFIFYPDLVTHPIGLDNLWLGFITGIGALSVVYGLNYYLSLNRNPTSLAQFAGLRVMLPVVGILLMFWPSSSQIRALVAIAAIIVMVANSFGRLLLDSMPFVFDLQPRP